jgi:PAS domain S-box-containing protein
MQPAAPAGDEPKHVESTIDAVERLSGAPTIDQLRLAVDAGQLGIWDWDIAANHVSWSHRVYELHGVAPDGFGGRVEDFAALVHPEDRARLQTQIEEALHGEVPYAAEFRVPLPDGRTRWLATRARVVRDEHGRPLRMVGTTYDVTERATLLAAERDARAAAEQAGRRLEILAMAGTVLSGSLEPAATLEEIASLMVPDIADWCRVDLLDADGVLQRALAHHSDPAKSRAGMALVKSLRASATTPGSMGWAVETGLSHLARFDAASDYDDLRDRDLLEFARTIGMRAYFVVPLIARGRTLGALAVLQAESNRGFTQDDCALVAEIAHRAALALDNARLYMEADQARRHAEQASRAKDEFLAMLGHELRNPLAPIVTALHLMSMRGDMTTEGERRIIERQVAHLSRLVDDLLDVSRITGGKIQLQREALDVALVVDKALELAHPLLEKRLHAVEVDLPAEPAHVMGDAVRLAQVLSNLLTNAAKFTPWDGHIAVRVAVDGEHVSIAVEDSGRGIEPALLPNVFDLFVQGSQPIDRQAGGLGLGLAIVKTLVHMHGGTVSAHSEGEQRGSRFVVRLPRCGAPAVAQSATWSAASVSTATGGRVLVVDDNVDAADTLAVLLEAAGYNVRTAMDGPRALRTLDTFTPDVAILDIGLPAMDGYELARRLRAEPRTAGVRLVALTGYGRDPDRVRALDGGFDEHLVKPVSAERLLEVLDRLLAT